MRRPMMALTVVGALGSFPWSARSQGVSENDRARDKVYFEQLREALRPHKASLPPELRRRLALAERWGTLSSPLHIPPAVDPLGDERARVAGIDSASPASTPLPPGRVNDPKRDLLYSNFTGITQNTSSTAWCAPNVVTVINNSEGRAAFYAQATSTFTDISYSYSANNGATFYYGGPFAPTGGPPFVYNPATVACTDQTHFFIAAEAFDGLRVFESTDGGKTFSAGVVAAPNPTGPFSIYGQPWIAADPSDPSGKTLYVAFTWTQFANPSCGPGVSLSPLVIKSKDGGTTWTAPTSLPAGAGCSPNDALNPTAAVGGDGHVYVAWWVSSGAATQQVGVATSVDGGSVFTASLTPAAPYVGDPAYTKYFIGSLDGMVLQAGVTFPGTRPQIAVDRSGRKGFNNTAYVVFEGPGTVTSTDAAAFFLGAGTYAYSDVFVIKSTDGGASFGPPLRVNQNVEPIKAPSPYAGRGSDQYMPGVGVDQTGAVGVCWYDRHNDPANFLIDRYCARSTNTGTTWVAVKKNLKSSPPLRLVLETYDAYNNVATDYRKTVPGFRSGYSDVSLGESDVLMTTF
jgi:hypothetical protein